MSEVLVSISGESKRNRGREGERERVGKKGRGKEGNVLLYIMHSDL